MQSTTSRRAVASLVSGFASPSSRSLPQLARQRAIQSTATRSISVNARRWQQATPAANASQPTAPRPAQASKSQSETPNSTSAAISDDEPAQTPTPNELSPESSTLQSLTDGLDPPPPSSDENPVVDWGRSYHGLSSAPFTNEQATILQQEIPADDIEIKPDGIIYMPEIKYRRILNRAFGPGGWGLAPRGETIVTGKLVTREYGLVVNGRLTSIARGEQQYFDPDGIPTATEGCKSNALMRCCKDLGIASELWDPRFIRKFMKEHGKEVMVEHVMTKKRRRHWMRKDDELRYPFKEVPMVGQGQQTSTQNGFRR